jgi:hypothetical protein
MAYSITPNSVTVPYSLNSITNKKLSRFLEKELLRPNDFKLNDGRDFSLSAEECKKCLLQSRDEFLNLFMEREIVLPSEKEIFSRKWKAKLLKIPHSCSNALWKNLAIRKFICEDAFIKSKKYWLMPQEGPPGRTILALYHHAELNNILIDGTLYILGNDRIRAIANKTEIYRDKDQAKIKSYLVRKGFHWGTSNDGINKDESFIKKPDILDVYNFMTLGPGGNKEIFKVERVRNT